MLSLGSMKGWFFIVLSGCSLGCNSGGEQQSLQLPSEPNGDAGPTDAARDAVTGPVLRRDGFVGAPCTAASECTCLDLRLVAPDIAEPRCVSRDRTAEICAFLTCPPGEECVIAESNPGILDCR